MNTLYPLDSRFVNRALESNTVRIINLICTLYFRPSLYASGTALPTVGHSIVMQWLHLWDMEW